MGLGHSSSVPSRIATTRTNMSDQLNVMQAESNLVIDTSPIVSMEECDPVPRTLVDVTAAFQALDLSNEAMPTLSEPPSVEEMSGENHPYGLLPVDGHETCGMGIVKNMADDGLKNLVPLIQVASADGHRLSESNIPEKPDITIVPCIETNAEQTRLASEPEVVENNSAVSPVSSSSASFAMNIVTDGALNSEYTSCTPKSTGLERSMSCTTTLNSAVDINARLDTRVEVRVYPCSNSTGNGVNKKFTQFTIKPEGVIIQGTHRHRSNAHDIGAEYASFIGRKLQRYELSDSKACQLLVTTHGRNFWVVPAPEAFSRHSGTCRLLGDRKHPQASHTLQVGDFLRVGSVGIVVIETHNGKENKILSEEKIQKIMKDTTNSTNGFLDFGDTDGENSDDSFSKVSKEGKEKTLSLGEAPVCYMCFDDENSEENPLIAPCKCRGDTRYVHVNCLRKWHTAEADNQICFLSSVDATCSVCKSTFKSDLKLRDGRLVKLFKSSLEPPYISLLVATKHEMAQRLFNTRFQLSFSTLMKPDGMNATRPLLLGRSSMSDMVLDYRTVSARHARIAFKNNEFIFTDAGSSNGSYLYLRRPVELSTAQPVQFRMGRSMISMKVVNRWNRRIFRAVRRSASFGSSEEAERDDISIGSNDGDIHVLDSTGNMIDKRCRRTRESIIDSLPAFGQLSQLSPGHFDLLQALAYPKRSADKDLPIVISKKADPVLHETLNATMNNDVAGSSTS